MYRSVPIAASSHACRTHRGQLLCSTAAVLVLGLTISTGAGAQALPPPDHTPPAGGGGAATTAPNQDMLLQAATGQTENYGGNYHLDDGTEIRWGGAGLDGRVEWFAAGIFFKNPGPGPKLTLRGLSGTMAISQSVADGFTLLNPGRLIMNVANGNATIDFNGSSAHPVAFWSIDTAVGNAMTNTGINTVTLAKVDGTTTATVAGSIQQNLIVEAQEGTLRLLGNNTHTGGTFIGTAGSRATVEAGSNTALGTGSVRFQNNASTLILNNSVASIANDIVFNTNGHVVVQGETLATGRLSGSQSFIKEGAGRLTLSGDSNPFAGSTELNGGGLELASTGVLGGAQITVKTGTTLSGTGTVTNLVSLDGVIAPGLGGGVGFGTLNVGSIIFQPSGQSTYQVTVGPGLGQNDEIVVTGHADLRQGTVDVQAQGTGYTPNSRYRILRYGTVQGQFAAVRSNFAYLAPTLDYSQAGSVWLDLARLTDPVTGNPISLNSTAVTPNQYAVATAADRLDASMPLITAILGHTPDEARRAFDILSGEANVSATSVAVEDNGLVRRAVLDRLRSGPQGPALGVVSSTAQAYSADLPARKGAPVVAPVAPGPSYSLWGQAFGARGHLDGNGNAASLDRNAGGLVIGVDTGFDGRWRAGFAGAYTRSTYDVSSRLSSGEIDSYHLVGYGSAQSGGLALRGGLAYAHHEVDTSRTILFRNYSGAVGTSFSGSSLQGFAEAGYGIQLASVNVEPFVGLAHVSTDLGGFAEAGDAAALTGHLGRQDVTYSSLGVRVAVPLGNLTAKAGVSWRHAFGDVTPTGIQAFAQNPAVPFTIAGTPLARDTIALETGLDWAVSRNVAIGLQYDGQFANKAQEHALKGSLRVSF